MSVASWSGAIGALLLSFVLAQSDEVRAGDTLMLASGQSSAPSYTAGVGLASLIKFKLLPTDKIDLQAIESSGAVDNVHLLQDDKAQLAILPSAISHAARLGTGSFAGNPPETGFRAIATLWRDALHLVVRENDVTTGTIDDLLKLQNRKVFLGDASAGMVDANQLLFADLGLDANQAFKLATVEGGDGIAAIKRGEVDAFSSAARPPEAMFESVFGSPATGLRLLDVTESQMARVNGNHWLWTPYVIPAATYPGQDEDIWTIGLSNLLVVRADVDSEVVYEITKSMFENLAYLQRIDPLMKDLSLEAALAGMAMPLHPGALRYYNEMGLIPRPDSREAPSSPTLTPARQNQKPDVGPEHYPDANVAGRWSSKGTGGPLLRTAPPDGLPATDDKVRMPGHSVPSTSQDPLDGRNPDEQPYWRQRATL